MSKNLPLSSGQSGREQVFLILAAAEKAGASVLYSEDLQHGQHIAGVLIQNPFLAE